MLINEAKYWLTYTIKEALLEEEKGIIDDSDELELWLDLELDDYYPFNFGS